MTNNNHNQVDERLIKLIGLLRPTPLRNPKAVEENRLKFLAEVDAFIGADEKPSQKKKFYLFQPKEKTNMNAFKPKFALTTLFVVAAIFIFLFGGTGLTVYAAQSALPGDALYPVKTGLEQTRLSLTSEEDRVAQLHLSLAQKRLDEIESLIKEGRYDQVGTTSAEFERQIQLAVKALKSLAEKDPARAAELTTQMMAELSTYTKALTGMLSNLPDDVKVEVEKAIIGSESAGMLDDSAKSIEFTGVVSSLAADSWTILGRQVAVTPQTEIKGTFAVGDTVKVHVRVNADGSLIAIEIEAGAAVGNGNDNLNANDNSNANTNSNENENSNANSNENGNGNENSNENENENSNDNSNANDSGEDEFEFKGTVQTILPDLWVIGGITVAVSGDTNIRGKVAVGDKVEVHTFELPDGSLLAIEIKLEDGSSNDNGDDSGSGSDNSNDNSNENGDDHGSDDGSSNDNGDDSGDDSGSNDNGDDSGSNDNGDDNSGSGGGGGSGNDNGKGG